MDNEAASIETGPDAHGQAAFLLVESLIHGLIARTALTVKEAIEIVQIAEEVTQDVGETWGGSLASVEKSRRLLSSISISLMHDIPAPDGEPEGDAA